MDYNYSDSSMTPNAFQVTNMRAENWFEADLSPVKDALSNNDYTQMRILFQETTISNRYEGWYSGNSAGNEPQLIIRYQL